MTIASRAAPLIPLLMLVPALAAAHTSLETSVMSEGVRIVNNLQIGHACGAGTSVLGSSVVFPDGIDSTIFAGGAPYAGPLSDFLSNWGPNIQPLVNRAVFTNVDEKQGPNGNVVGFWAGGGPGIPDHMVGYVPFRVNATNIVPQSCAVSVRFYVNVVDVCTITSSAQLHDEGVAEFWTHNDLGTIYDRQSASDDGVARLTIARNLTDNPLPAGCGAGYAVEVKASKEQIERDMPIRVQGVQIWPK
ncbi:MAG: hypothetical protein ACO1PZ_02290 [Gammaproteobacteria bacterium]